MTTFKNNAKYAELIFTYLDAAYRDDTPLSVPDVLRAFRWKFKGGNLASEALATEFKPATSDSSYPDCSAEELADKWPEGRDAWALRSILQARKEDGRLRARGVLARLASYQMVTSSFGLVVAKPVIYSGMKAIYHAFSLVWEWAARPDLGSEWTLLMKYTRELLAGTGAIAKSDIPTVEKCRQTYERQLMESRLSGLLIAVKEVKDLIRTLNGPQARKMARMQGLKERETWDYDMVPGLMDHIKMSDPRENVMFVSTSVGPCMFRVLQGVALLGVGPVRYAMSMSDVERFHQLIMSAASAIVGTVAQAATGTALQKSMSRKAVEVAERNISRIVESSKKVALGDEVLVCKGYRRAYTAFLGVLAGKLCKEETAQLVKEAKETAPDGVIDVDGMISDGRQLDAASALNALKMFKICPAPDVSPGGALIDRVRTIGNGNKADPDMMPEFETELRSQILRAYIRSKHGRLELRYPTRHPVWYMDYLKGNMDKVPSHEIDEFLKWEGDAVMPDMSEYDPANWKDSGLGADTLRRGLEESSLGHMGNMLTRLLFDDGCPMPGREVLSDDHVIKFFVKAEGHKEPARGIFSANLTDRQAQSWMEKAVDKVAKHHPSYMIGQGIDERDARVTQLTERPMNIEIVPMYYSFDISGWSGKMPAQPQRISHSIWAKLYGGHLFERATAINEDATVYLNMDGYKGWFKNTHANLEGFNGKEMTMVLVALLSLSVRRWRTKVVEARMISPAKADGISALLFAYIDDGLSRIDLPVVVAVEAFQLYKETVIETFSRCGFTVETSKCFPSDRFAIFLNEIYLAGRHVVHGVRAAMAISSEPTERHTSLVERVSSVATGVRGAVAAGLDPTSAVMLMAYHILLHLIEWVPERDPVVLAGWSLTPRAWGGLGLPNVTQLFMTGSASAFEESVATMQAYARMNDSVRKAFIACARGDLATRNATSVMVAPMSSRVDEGYMVDSRISVEVRKALHWKMSNSVVSRYAKRLLRYAEAGTFNKYCEAIVPLSIGEVLQEQMLVDLSESHPHSVFSTFARRLEKSSTVRSIVGFERFVEVMRLNRLDAALSVSTYRRKTY